MSFLSHFFLSTAKVLCGMVSETQQVIQAQRTAMFLMVDKWAKAVLWPFKGQYSQMNSMLIQ